MGKTLPVVWAEEAVRDAVRRVARALQTVDKDAFLLGKLGVTTQDLWCLVDAGRAALGQADATGSDTASAHLSGVDLPADGVAGELRDRIAANLTRHLYWHPGRCECGWKVNETGDVDWQAQFRAHVARSIVDELVAPLLAAKDRDVEQTRIRLAQTLNLPHSRTLDQLIDDVSEVFSGWVRMAREIGGLRRELKLTEGFRQQYAEERDEALDDVERLRPALSKALADLVVRRQALANVLGVTDAGGVSGYYRMIQDVADLRAELGAIRARAQLAEDERDKANRQNESLARRLHLRFQNEQKLSAELEELNANAVVLTDALHRLGGLIATDSRDWAVDRGDAWIYGLFCGWECDEEHVHDKDCDATPSLADRHGWSVYDVRRLRRYRAAIAAVQNGGQPDTEATEARHVDIDIVDHVVTGEAIAENPKWAHTAFVMAADVRTIIREWCAANGIPVDTEATEHAPREPRVVRKKKDCFHPWPGCNCPVIEDGGTQ